MKLATELEARGFVHQYTGETLAEVLDGESRTIYHGIDPSADSAHAGNMVIWMLLRRLHEAGHRVIFLVGGGTGMIGDPKPDSERTLQDPEIIAASVEKIKQQAARLIGGGAGIEFVNNADWLLNQSLISFLRDIGKYFTVNELLKKDAIASRLESEQGISYTEFAYPLLQGFDYLTLYRDHGCTLQVGGSDQWGNIVAGVDLIRRKEQAVAHALTVPLVTDKATGKKFGKSEGNAIWLDAAKTSPYAFYQFWLNVNDASVIEYLKLFTFISLAEIEDIEQEFAMNPGGRLAQRRLAEAVTTFVHGADTTALVKEASDVMFADQTLDSLSNEVKDLLLANAPTASVSVGDALIDVLVTGEIASSKREARTFVESGAVGLNGKKLDSVETVLETPMFTNGVALLRRGKKHMVVLVLE